jgi:hypothetical protein
VTVRFGCPPEEGLLPPPPAELLGPLEHQREADAEEFEALIAKQGLLEALGKDRETETGGQRDREPKGLCVCV